MNTVGDITTISERIFERLKQISMTQKEFALKSGIKESTISEWKKNRTLVPVTMNWKSGIESTVEYSKRYGRKMVLL